MKKYLALVAAGGALAIGVPAALAATDAPSTPRNTPVQSATPTPDQSRPDDGDGHRGGRGDCPEKDGSGGGSGSTAPDSSDTTL
jgi:hypothetical protein